MNSIFGTALAAVLLLSQAQLLYPCGHWSGPYFSSGFWHEGFYVNRWCPVLPPRS